MKWILEAGAVTFALACCVSACGVTESSQEPNMDESTSSDAAELKLPVSAELKLALSNDTCWKHTTVRGVGKVPSECPGGEKSGALCYPRCPNGYTGVGPVCWQDCPAGYKDDGAFCRRDAHIMSADTGSCPWYDKCGLTFSKGCSKCPPGYANDGCTCRKDAHIFAKATQTRGAGTSMSCPAGYDTDAGLCYPPCGPGTRGVGPVCWAYCAGELAVECGAGCARTSDACAEATANKVLKSAETVVAIALKDFGGALEAGIAAANEFNLPICAQPITIAPFVLYIPSGTHD